MTYTEDQRIVNQGDEVNATNGKVWIITQGSVRIVQDGKTVTTRGKGSIIGEGALMGTKRNADAIADAGPVQW